MRIWRSAGWRRKSFPAAVKVGEVAASAAEIRILFPRRSAMFEHGDAASALAGFDGAQQARRAAAENMASKEWIMFDTY